MPVLATYAPGASQQNNLYVVEKSGAIKTVNLTNGTTTALINISSTGANFLSAANEQGLLGLAFHPQFQTNGFFYVHYTYGTGNGNIRVERYQMDPATNAIVPAGQQTVIQFPHPQGRTITAAGCNSARGIIISKSLAATAVAVMTLV